MKNKILTSVAALCLFMVCFAAVMADISGKWVGNITTPDGNQIPLNYTFKVDGAGLTGLASSPQGEVPLTDGKIDGDNFTFSIDVNGTSAKHTGKFYSAADSIGMDIDFNGMKFHSTLKRVVDK